MYRKVMQMLGALLDLGSQYGPPPVVWPLRDHLRRMMTVLVNELVLGWKENLTLIRGLLPLRRVLNPNGCMQIVVSRRLLCLGEMDR